jgi:iron complex outermembrane receptor protein
MATAPNLHRPQRRVPRLLACLLLLAGAFAHSEDPQPQPADQKLKSLTLEQLGEIEVTTYSKAPSQLLKTPAAIYVITSDDILRSGATNIAEALRLAPGVEVGRMNSDNWAIGIRGLQNNFSKSVLVLIDGRNVYAPIFAGTYWDVQDMPLEDIDRIEVIRGPGGTIWGANSANGVINIITKKSSETPGVQASALAGDQDHTIDDLQFGLHPAKDLTLRAFGRGFQRAHEYHTDGINEDAWHQERIGIRADYLSGPNTFFAEADAYLGTSPRIVGTTPLYDKTSGGDINLSWDRQISPTNGTHLQLYFDRTLRTDDAFFGETRNTIDLDYLHHFRLGKHNEISYGGGFRISPYLYIAQNPDDTLIPPKSTDDIETAFVQDTITFTPNLTLTLGAKLEHNNDSGFDIQPSARALWSPTPHQAIWAGVTRAVTTPSDLEENIFIQEAAAPHLYVQVLGNPKFQSEDVVGYEAGYRIFEGDRFYVDIAAFFNQLTHLQSFSAENITSSAGNTYINIQYQNLIAGHTSGFEFAPRITVTPWWRLSPTWSFVSSTFTASGPTSDISSTGSVNTYEHSNPRHQVYLQSHLDLPAHIQFDQTYRYITALPAQKVNAYQTLDLRAARPLGKDFLLEAVGQNLLQPHHKEWGTGDPTQPVVGINRAAYIKLTYTHTPR